MASVGSSLYTLFLTIIYFARFSQTAFSGQECMLAHNALRAAHSNTEALKYSTELEKEAQEYADKLAINDPALPIPTRDLPKRKRRNVNPTTGLFHKELWDGEIHFPSSSRDLNQGRSERIGESIHQFCCYSFPHCPREFFHNLNFPPSAKGVVRHFYEEMKNYDFASGGKKTGLEDDAEIRHFTNIVWKSSTVVGCGQSKRSSKGCIYTVIRYKTEGSVGGTDQFKVNVERIGPDEKQSNVEQQNSYFVAFIIVVVVVLIIVAFCGIAYAKRDKIRAYYAEIQIKRGTKKAEASLRESHDEESQTHRSSIISKFSTRKTRPSIYVVPNLPPANTVPLQAREPIPTYQNIAVMYTPENGAVSIVDKRASVESKHAPPRPMSPVKADSPALRTSAANQHGRSSFTPENPVAETLTKEDKPVLKPYVNLDFTPEPVTGKTLPAGKCPAKEIVRAPIPVPRPGKQQGPNISPKPAPRPMKVSTEQAQVQPTRTIVPGRATRASKKNPNFRTLPLNDRGSIKRPEKPISEEEDSTDTGSMPSGTNDTQKKVPIVPCKKPKPVVPQPTKKPLLPKPLKAVKDDDIKRSSVLEARRLLEQNNQH